MSWLNLILTFGLVNDRTKGLSFILAIQLRTPSFVDLRTFTLAEVEKKLEVILPKIK